MAENLFTPGANCWCIKDARRASFLIDGEDYFGALHQAMIKARRSIIIVGWDLHSGLRLVRHEKNGDYPETLGKFLDFLARTTDGLKIYLLSWDFAMIYALEREFFPRYKLKWRSHENIHFCLDGQHPVGASQHQKVVVIDDAVAFSGGFDLSKWRWDTSRHLVDEKLRVDPDGKSYPPFHDIQMVVEGEAAAALGELARIRWQRACGETLPPHDREDGATPWPDSVIPDFTNVDVAISRTLPRYNGHDEVREVERLYLDTIAKAKKYIYIENQYLSSYRIGEAVRKRLEEESGPEIVMVLPHKTGGWLEQHTMDVLRGRIMKKLRQADRHDRLRIYYPRLAVKPEVHLMVHAKVMVIDDSFVRVGSSNLSNRSLGLDSECDLAILATNEQSSTAIAAFRNRLLAEHLGCAKDQVKNALRDHQGFIVAIESLRKDDDHTLMPLDGRIEKELDQLVPESKLLDPEKPIEPEEFLDYIIKPEHQRPAYRHIIKIIAMISTVLLLAALWRWTPLDNYLNVATLLGYAKSLKANPFGPVLVPLIYIGLGCVSFPLTLLIIATMIVYGPWWGSWYALVGTVLSASAMFLLGHLLGKKMVSKLSGSLINRVNQHLSQEGLKAVITVHILPVAPFSLINLIAGVSSIQFRDFFLGTLIGILPGIATIALVTDRLSKSLRQPDITSFSILFAVIAMLGIGLFVLRKWIKHRHLMAKQNHGS